MKKKFRRVLPICLICAVGAAAILIGLFYYNFISHRIYEDSTGHLEEIYSQVNRSFGSFLSRNWGLLNSWGEYFGAADGGEDRDGDLAAFIARKQEYWGFSEFYFLSEDRSCMTPDGVLGSMDLGDAWEPLMEQKKSVLAGETLPDGQGVTVFALPVPADTYRGFSYCAIAVSYNNADLTRSLNVDAFSGKAKCFVIHSDGNVLLSTQSGGSVFSNYLTYLEAASDLDKEGLEKLKKDWENASLGLIPCKIGGVNHYVLYQPIGYQDYLLLSVVPENAVSAGFLSVQKSTVCVLIVIFALIGAAVLGPVIASSQKRFRQDRMELQYREFMFDVLSNTVDDIFIMLDLENRRIDYVSPNIERLLGIPAKEARENIRVVEKCAPGCDVAIDIEELEAIPLSGKLYRECEYTHQTTGERRWYKTTVYHTSIQEVKKYVIVLSDCTREQQMNQKLKEALAVARSANEAKSNFLSNMSHDIRTPMNAIVGFSVLLERDAGNADKVREYIRKIMASSHHLLSLINDVLDMSKIESGKTSLNVESFCLPEVLEELNIILLPQAKAKKQAFEIHVQGAPPEQLTGDRLRLNQILLNLLSNAVKYTPEGGRVEFLVRELPETAPQYAKLQFVVRDNGIGMSEEFQKQIFVPFSREISSVTNEIQGTGLGMAITKNLVDLMGGIIRLESRLGAGSTFTVELSFALPEQAKTSLRFQDRVTRLLVADDEEEIGLDIQRMMQDTGVAVSFVTDGRSAVEKAVSAHKRGEDFHVILLDWKMPGMNGVETARRIREEVGSAVPILVLTSYDWSEIEEQAREAGINAFMPKPFFVSTFWQTIAPLFEEEEPQEGPRAEIAESALQGLSFLVAEDNELNAEILTEMLHMEGAECEVAVNGKEALERFMAAEPGTYDMILMDVQMPVMNGYEATRRIRACGHPEAGAIPIVAMTANTFAEDVRNALDAGMDGHLAKPIDMPTVRRVVGEIMSRRRKGSR